MTDIEQRLIDFDRAMFRVFRTTEFLMRGPRVILEYFEFTYLLAYPFVPGSFALICQLGGRAEADSYCFSVLVAGYCAYGILPWI